MSGRPGEHDSCQRLTVWHLPSHCLSTVCVWSISRACFVNEIDTLTSVFALSIYNLQLTDQQCSFFFFFLFFLPLLFLPLRQMTISVCLTDPHVLSRHCLPKCRPIMFHVWWLWAPLLTRLRVQTCALCAPVEFSMPLSMNSACHFFMSDDLADTRHHSWPCMPIGIGSAPGRWCMFRA